MIYDDTRWVQRLVLMGCWNESQARKAAEKRREGATGQVQGRTKSGHGDAIPGITLFDSTKPESSNGVGKGHDGTLDLNDGFDAVSIAPINDDVLTSPQDSISRLEIFKYTQSLRGRARQEYGKIYRALAPYYWNAVDCDSPTQAIIFRTYRDPKQQAMMLSSLERFSKSDISAGRGQRKEKFDVMVGAFESAVTKEFEQALDSNDVSGKMSKYAHVLVCLNGGQRGVQMFLDRNPLFDMSVGNPRDGLTAGIFNGEKSNNFFASLSSTFNEQVSIIDQVFPPSIDVVVPLLERVGKNLVSDYVTAALEGTHRASVETYLKAASTVCGQALACAKSLRPAMKSGDEFYDAIDQMMINAFEPHADLYLAEELSYFKTKSESEVSDWEKQLSEQDASMQSMFMSNVNRQVDKKDFLTSFKKVVMMPVNVLPTSFGGKPATAKALVNGENLETPDKPTSSTVSRSTTPGVANGNTFSTNRPASPLPEPPTTELAAKTAILNSRLEGIRSLFSIEVALNLVHTAKQSIERAVVFLNLGGHFAIDTRRQCELIFICLLQILGNRHIKDGFDQAITHLSEYKPREVKEHSKSEVEPLVTFLELVNVGDLIQQMIDVFYEQELVATNLTAKDDVLNAAAKEKKKFEQMLDSSVAAGLNKGIEVLMDEIEYICATTQKPEDFNPEINAGKDGAVYLFDVGPSLTARQVVELVEKHTKMLVGSTDKNTLDVFNQEVGMRLFAALCKHLKRQRISTTGSIKLIR